MDVSTKDRFWRTPPWWAGQRRSISVRQLLLKYVGNPSEQDCGPEAPGVSASVVAYGSSRICDVSTLGIPKLAGWYYCNICNGGDFDICVDCYALGTRCLDDEHDLGERTENR